MSRDVPSAVLTALEGKEVFPFFAVSMAFLSGTLYMWSGYGDLVYGGNTYIGAGQLLSISAVSETTELEAKGSTLTLSGIPSSFLSLALSEQYQGRECNIYFGLLTANTVTPIDSFVEIFSGELDQMNISEAADTATISVTAENALIKLERPVVRRFTDSDQRSRFPTDKGLEFVAGLQDKEIFWGRKGTS